MHENIRRMVPRGKERSRQGGDSSRFLVSVFKTNLQT